MYVPLYQAKGILAIPLRKDGVVLRVDPTLLGILQTLGENHTYLQLTGECGVEIVKTLAVLPTGVYVERAVDYTEALDFKAGDTVDYTLTVAEIEDRIPKQALTLHRSGGIEINGTEVRYADITLTFFGANEQIGEDWNIIIGRKENAYGCCDAGNDADPVPARPFYLTTHPYPLEHDDAFGVSGTADDGHMYPGLTQALDGLDVSGTITAGTLRVILKTHAQFKEDALEVTAEAIAGTIQQILKTHAQFKEDALIVSAEALAGTIRQILLTHSQFKEDALEVTAECIAGTLT